MVGGEAPFDGASCQFSHRGHAQNCAWTLEHRIVGGPLCVSGEGHEEGKTRVTGRYDKVV